MAASVCKIVNASGVSGVGKTTVLEELRRAEPKDSGIAVVQVSDVLRKVAEQHKKDLESCTRDELYVIQTVAMQEILNMPCKVAVVSTHNVKIRQDGCIEVLTPEDHAKLVSLHVVITAHPKSVFKRRVQDMQTKKRFLDMALIERELEAEVGTAFRLAATTNVPAHVLCNDIGPAGTAKILRCIIAQELGV